MTLLERLVFLPRPRKIEGNEGSFSIHTGTWIRLRGDPSSMLSIARDVKEEILRETGIECPIHAGEKTARETPEVLLCLGGSEGEGIPRQGYTLLVSPSGLKLRASDPAGLFYGAATLAQIVHQTEGRIPCGAISDSPDFPVRGVMLDISRDKVPTMETLFDLVEQLSRLKVNHIQLYTEHTFAYTGHEEVWAGASPMTGEEILRLDAYCRERFIELVPNQNSFGHLHRWLALPRYRGLAECPEGFDWPWGGRSRLPFSLDPSNPGGIALLDELYGELLPHFTSGLFNVGCDETFDIGQGRNRERVSREGRGRVYLDFILKIYSLVKRHGRKMLFWGDIIMQHPELVPELPRDLIALEWGYEAEHPFDEHAARFSDSTIPFYVCPGTSSWNSIAGRTKNCLGNLRLAAAAGLSHGALGYLTTDWGDNGHWQALPVSYLGFAAGAACSWCLAANSKVDPAQGLDAHVFRDKAGIMGRLASDLGNTYLHEGVKLHNESLLFRLLHTPEDGTLPPGATVEALKDARRHIESAASALDHARLDRRDAAVIHDEFAHTVRLLLHACDRGIALREGTLDISETKSRFAADLRVIIGEHNRLWMLRNRVGGLQDSVRGLTDLLERRGGRHPGPDESQMKLSP